MSFSRKAKKIVLKSSEHIRYNSEETQEDQYLTTSLEENLRAIKNDIGESTDLVFRDFQIGIADNRAAAVIYTDGLSDSKAVHEFIMETLMLDVRMTDLDKELKESTPLLSILKNCAMTVGDIKEFETTQELYNALLTGDVIFLLDQEKKGLIIGNKKWVERGVEEPTSQTVVRGPKEGFTENIRVNTALIRRIIKDPNLWMETVKVGTRTKTSIAVLYINGVAKDSVVKEVLARLDKINIDGILESANVEEFIQDSQISPFPTVYHTERPDAIAAGLLQGKVAIVVDGTPFVLLVPALFIQFFHSPEDHYQRPWMASMIRLLRFGAFGITLLLPALYIALINFHHEMIPTELLISIAAQRENTPFSAVIEVVIMEVAFELLREAGLRMPRVIGSAMSIVGGFVIGTAAVEAGLISAVIVIVVSLTAIASFVSPSYNIAIAGRILRFGFILVAANFGLYGILLGLILFILHLCNLQSFGTPYMYPFAPFSLQGQKDTIFRMPVWAMVKRPSVYSDNSIKQKVDNSLKRKNKKGNSP